MTLTIKTVARLEVFGAITAAVAWLLAVAVGAGALGVMANTAIVALAFVILTLAGKQLDGKKRELKGVELRPMLPLTLLDTKKVNGAFERLGRSRLTNTYTKAAGYVMVPVAIAGTAYMLFKYVANFSMLHFEYTFPSSPSPVQGFFSAVLNGAYANLTVFPMIGDGITTMIPLLLIVGLSVAFHEASHGIAATSNGVRVKSTGIITVGLVIPIGAYVDVDDEEIKKAFPRIQRRFFQAGILANLSLAAVALGLYLLSVWLTVPMDIHTASAKALFFARPQDWLIAPTNSWFGFMMSPAYFAQGYISPVPVWMVYAFYWTWIVNLSLAFLNSLPLPGTDGWQSLKTLGKGAEFKALGATWGISTVALSVVVPWFGALQVAVLLWALFSWVYGAFLLWDSIRS